MNPIPEQMLHFLQSNKVCTLCFVTETGEPYCINCFYAFLKEEAVFIFKSGKGTQHDRYIQTMRKTSGTVLADTLDVLHIKGIQFSGEMMDSQQAASFSSRYIHKFPFSITHPGYYWAIHIQAMKYTDRQLGFGKKILWQRV